MKNKIPHVEEFNFVEPGPIKDGIEVINIERCPHINCKSKDVTQIKQLNSDSYSEEFDDARYCRFYECNVCGYGFMVSHQISPWRKFIDTDYQKYKGQKFS